METHSSLESESIAPQKHRRGFLQWLGASLGAVAAGLVGIPFIGYVFRTPKNGIEWVDLGPVKNYPAGETRTVHFDNPLRQPWDGMTAHTSVFVRFLGQNATQQDQFLILAVNCAHLGCPVTWFPQSELFMCPCHGGVYYSNGERASGPPPRGLFPCEWRVRKGTLEVQAPHFPTLQDTLQTPA
jgi:Rieske Fe-S protein